MLKVIEGFLLKERKNGEIFFIFSLLLALIFFYTDLIHILFSYFSPTSLPTADKLISDVNNENQEYGFIGFLAITLAYVLYEEILFRLPVVLFLRIHINIIYKILMIILLSLIFAGTHFYNSSESKFLVPILLQGMMGIIMSIVFIISGANVGKYLKAFMVVVVFHLIINLSILIYMI